MSHTPKILAVSVLTPPHCQTQETLTIAAEQWTSHFDESFRSKVRRVFRNAGVEKRYTVLPIEEVFLNRGLTDKNAIYQSVVVDYCETVLKEALDKAGLTPQDIDCLITTSCTGHMSPSIDAHLINRLDMRPETQRLPVMEMGCMAGANGLVYAENYLKAYPERYVALIAAELTTLTFQAEDYSWANIVSAGIFADGVACAILGPSKEMSMTPKPVIKRSQMLHFPDSTDLLGFNLETTGFRMVLDEALPDVIVEQFDTYTHSFLAHENWRIEDLNHAIVHPGGKKIIDALDKKFLEYGIALDESRSILRDYGNVSSATVLFILNEFMSKPIDAGEKAILLAFGPGVTACSLLLEWDS